MLQIMPSLKPERDLASRVADLEGLFRVDMATLSEPLARARSECDARAAELAAAKRAFAALAANVMPGIAIGYQTPEIQAAHAAVEKADARLKAASDAVRAARQRREEAFNQAVLGQLANAAETLEDVADIVNSVARALALLHTTCWQHGVSMPSVLDHVPVLQQGARALTVIANRAS